MINLTRLTTAALLTLSSLAQPQKHLLENYSFDYSSSVRPLSWLTRGNAVELNSKVKLNPAVEDRWGGYVFDGVFN